MKIFRLDWMKRLGLINISFILILASKSKGQDNWRINVTKRHQTTVGSDITIPCTFTVPESFQSKDIKAYWKTSGTSICSREGKDKRAFVSHPNDTCVHEDFKGRTLLLGDPSKGDCKLKIKNVRKHEPAIYLRISTKNENFSFSRHPVFISVYGVKAVTSPPMRSFTDPPGLALYTTQASDEFWKKKVQSDTQTMYWAIFVPVAAGIIILLVGGIFLIIKHKRRETFNREESGYYANFSRASPTPPRSGALSKGKDHKLTEAKDIDEPVYMNMEAPITEMDQDTHRMDNIYGNVDYSK